MKLTVRNYRSYSNPRSFSLDIAPGIYAIVGPNNGGKSNVLKFLYEFRHMFSRIGFGQIGSEVSLTFPTEVRDTAELFAFTNDDAITIMLEVESQAPTGLRLGMQAYRVYSVDRITIKFERGQSGCQIAFASNELGEIHPTFIAKMDQFPDLFNPQIPETLLDMRLISEAALMLSDSLYIGPYRNLSNAGGKQNYFDLPIGDQFITAWNTAYAGTNRAQNRSAQSILEEIADIFGFDHLAMPAGTGFLNTYVNGNPFRIDEHGAGMTEFIMILYAVEQRRPSLILIDEPELHLHPQLQLRFLAAVAARAKVATLFATHSLGLARSAADRIYSVRRTADRASEFRDFSTVNNPNEVLGELSFAGNYALGHKAILLVEGSTEYKTYQEILRKFRADQKLTLLSLGGSTLINGNAKLPLIEIKRLSDLVFAMVDSDRTELGGAASESVRQFESVCRELDIPILVYERRAIENYLTGPIVEDLQNRPALGPFERPTSWRKAMNWRIAREMSREDWESTDIGQFLLGEVFPRLDEPQIAVVE